MRRRARTWPYRLRRRSAAFTLIELLVVIVILGILMAVAVPTFLRQQQKAQDSKTQQQLTTAYRAIRSGLAEFNNQYPAVASVVSVIAQSEPELTVSSGSCNGSTNDKQVVVDNVTSSVSKLSLYAKSSSGSWWNLSASASSAPVFTRLGTCSGPLSTGTLTVSGNEITDTVRGGGGGGSPDGLVDDSSYGIWDATTNLLTKANSDPFAAGALSSSGVTITPLGGGRYHLVNTSGVLRDYAFRLYANLSDLVNGDTYTGSIFYSNLSGGNMRLDWCDQPGAGIWSTPATPAGRAVVTASLATYSTTYHFLDIELTAGASVTVWWPQVELSNIATPYVAAPGDRTGGLVAAPASRLTEAQGWAAARFVPEWDSTSSLGHDEILFEWANFSGSENQISLWRQNTSNVWRVDARRNNVFTSLPISSAWTAGDAQTLIVAWTNSVIELSVNGAPFQTTGRGGTVGGSALPAAFQLGSRSGSLVADGEFKWFACGTGTLNDSDAAQINAWGSSDPTTQDFPAAAQATLAWSADSDSYVSGS